MSSIQERQSAHPEPPSYDSRRPAKLTPGGFYVGTVTHSHPVTKLFDVSILGYPDHMKDCIWAGNVASDMIGIKTCYMPPVGSRVVLLLDDRGYGLGMVPTDVGDLQGGGGRTLTGVPEANFTRWDTPNLENEATSHLGEGPTPGNDALEGEYELTNSLGVGLQLLTTIAKLQAGDRAKVEAFLLNDMVRIVSENFRHFSSFGDMEIYNDGRLNVVFNGTSYEHEAWGKLAPNDEKVPTTGTNSVDFSSISAMVETGRWRFSEYIGWLGDFFHQIISEPVKTVGYYAQGMARAGRGRVQVMGDGTILMQSVSDIVMEKVTRVQVPIQLRRWEDPEGNRKKQIETELNTKYLELWKDSGKPHNMAEACYQLRQYARWLNQYHSFARFMQLDKDWSVPAEAYVPAPDPGCREKDRQQANAGATHISTYSTIRIMRDGSQVHLDGYGNSIVMSEYGVQVSSPRHLELNSGGDIILNAGQNIRIKARRSIDIVSVIGGIKIKARAFLQALCELGTLWLKSDAPMNPDQTTGQEVPPENHGFGVLIDSTRAPVWVESGKGVTVNVTGGDLDLQTKAGAVKVIAHGSSDDGAHGGIVLKAAHEINLYGSRATLAGKLLVDGELRVGTDIRRMVMIRNGTIRGQQVNVMALSAKRGIRGPLIAKGSPKHGNHIRQIPDDFEVVFTEDTAIPAAPSQVTPTTKPTWRFEAQDEYLWDPNYKLRQTLSQQFMSLGDMLPGGVSQPEYGSWSYVNTDGLLHAPRTAGGSRPWPSSNYHEVYTGGESLHSPSHSSPDKHGATPTGLQSDSIVHRYLKP